MPSRFWSAVLHAAYLSYYLIIVAPAFYFAWRRNLVGLRHFILVVMSTFVVCYLVFIFFPVAGPYYVFPRPDAWFPAYAPVGDAEIAVATVLVHVKLATGGTDAAPLVRRVMSRYFFP